MAFSVSPDVSYREIDLTASIQSASSIEAAFAGKFRWGPVLERVLVSNEDQLAVRMGRPDSNSAVDFLTAASYLAYSDKLRVVRIGNQTEMSNSTDEGTGAAILNDSDYENSAGTLGAFSWIAKYPGALGNSLAVSTCTSADEFEVTLPGSFALARGTKTATYTPSAAEVLTSYFNTGDYLVVDSVRYQVAAVTSTTLTLTRLYAGSATPSLIKRLWQYATQFSGAPGDDELHVVVTDAGGEFTSEVGVILDTYASLSTASNATYADGTTAYYVDAINRKSPYIRVGEADITAINTTLKVSKLVLAGGVDGNDLFGDDEYMFGYDLFNNADVVDAPLIITGVPTATKVSYVIENIAEIRKDMVVFTSPRYADVVNNAGNEVSDSISFRESLPFTSYGFMDGNWKYMYDKYNDVFRWIPLNGDTAGIAARTERDRDAWFSIAGFNRGGYKNVVKLAYNPDRPQRDDLFVADINPAVDIPGSGPLLLGDKTMLGQASAFNEIGVRRLFIILEKKIAAASRRSLFEFNDPFTRAQFISLVEPFLREIKGRRGMIDFKVVADETVNTPQVVDSNQFVGHIYIKPNRSIRYIELSFIAVRSGVEFSEVVGQF